MLNKETLEEIVRTFPDSFPAKKLCDNFHLFEQLYRVHKEKWLFGCGSYLIDGQTYSYCSKMLKKQEELYRYAMNATNVLEIGVYLGHSLLIMLLANPNLTITAIDYDNTYAEPAIQYLNEVFGNRIIFIQSDAIQALKTLPHSEYDFIHIDADHNDEAVVKQFFGCLPLAKENCLFVFDDYDAVSTTIHKLVEKQILEVLVIPDCNWRNCITKLKIRMTN